MLLESMVFDNFALQFSLLKNSPKLVEKKFTNLNTRSLPMNEPIVFFSA